MPLFATVNDEAKAMAFAKAMMAAGLSLPVSGRVFLSVRDSDKNTCIEVARSLLSMGFNVCTTAGTHELLLQHSVETDLIRKVSEGVWAVDLSRDYSVAKPSKLRDATRSKEVTDTEAAP